MIDAETVGGIIRTYAKHGWTLRRVLLTPKLQKSLGDNGGELFGDVQITESSVDAAWFSRPPQQGEIAWELRHLSETPLALLEYADETHDDFERKLGDVEARLIKLVAERQRT